MANGFSAEATTVAALLTQRRNVLISGAPGTGKSRLLNEVARLFTHRAGATGPVHVPGAKVAIPATPPPVKGLPVPGGSKAKPKIFRTVFHQNSKYREFVTGIVPEVGAGAGAGTKFTVITGKLYEAAEHALTPDGASLLIIDEINRGPAVQIFGGSIVAIEGDKRLDAKGSPGPDTQFFDLLDPTTGKSKEYALPADLYILAAMNQADTSVEALDVAFLRRWSTFRLDPNRAVLEQHFGLGGGIPAPPAQPGTAKDVFSAAVRAWEAVNRRIALGRGAEFQIGHGALMLGPAPLAGPVAEALTYIREGWKTIRAHIDEVFFGDVRGTAATLNVVKNGPAHVYKLEERMFADEPRVELIGPDPVPDGLLYKLLLAVAEP